MTPEQSTAITAFFEAVTSLEQCGVIRSSRFLGDIGEFLCQSAFGVSLAEQLRQTGHDGVLGNDRVQVKFNNSTQGNNINVGDPEHYDMLVVVIGPRSKLREEDHATNEFRLYRYSKEEVFRWVSANGNFHCAKQRLSTCLSKKSIYA